MSYDSALCNGDCILGNKDEPDLIKSSLQKKRQSQQPEQLILTLPKREEHTTNEKQLGQQKPCSVDQRESPWLRSSRSKYNIRWLHCFISSVTCKSYDKLCCKMTPSDLTWSTNATPSTEGTKLNRNGQGRRNTISLVLLRLIIILMPWHCDKNAVYYAGRVQRWASYKGLAPVRLSVPFFIRATLC